MSILGGMAKKEDPQEMQTGAAHTLIGQPSEYHFIPKFLDAPKSCCKYTQIGYGVVLQYSKTCVKETTHGKQ